MEDVACQMSRGRDVVMNTAMNSVLSREIEEKRTADRVTLS